MVDPTTDVVVGGGLLSTAVLLVLRFAWRIYNSDRVEVHSDRVRIDLITQLREENKLLRERADMAFNERNAARDDRNTAMMETERLRNQVAMLHRDVSDLQLQLDILKERISLMPKSSG